MKGKNQTEEKWEETKLKLKNKFAKLTDSDLFSDIDKEDDFIGRLELLLGKSREEIKKIISEL